MGFFTVFGDQSKNNKIFEILLESKEATAKQIHNKLIKQYKVSTTYQATFKALQALLNSKVIKKQGLSYILNIDWLLSQRDMLNNVVANRLKSSCVYDSNEIKVYKLRTLKEVDNFIQENVVQLNNKIKVSTTYWKCPHCWWLLGYPIEEEGYIEEYDKNDLKSFAVITSKTVQDLAAKRYYQTKNKVYTSVAIKTDKEDKEVVQVLGDYSLICNLPENIFRKLRAFYEKADLEPNISEILKIINEPAEFELKVVKNKNLAKAYAAEIMKNFKKN